MFQRIVVPLDGSSFAEGALPFALSIGRRAGGRLELVTVEEPDHGVAFDEWASAARDWSRSYLEEVAGHVRSARNGEVGVTLLEGVVAEALLDHARRGSADLVVMATHGRGAVSRAWLGSVADAFVRRAPCPVLLVRPREAEEEETALLEDKTFGHILVPLDGSDFSRSIVEPAVALGSLFGARFTILRVLSFPTELASPYLPHTVQMNVELVEEARQAALAYAEGVAGELRERGLEATGEVSVDPQAAHAILRRAEDGGADVIALATHGRSGAARLVLGSTTDKVIRGAHRPVLVLRPPDAD